ncbi:hypothetical protein HAP94_18700 [Acidithiobacillus ferrivorans]|nr:hypothetical protein [Acidithiobacillus ferrivorans]
MNTNIESSAAVRINIINHGHPLPDGNERLEAMAHVSKVIHDTAAATEYGCRTYGERYVQSRGAYNVGLMRAGEVLIGHLEDGRPLGDATLRALKTESGIRRTLHLLTLISKQAAVTTH